MVHNIQLDCYWCSRAHPLHRSGCKGWPTPECTAAVHTSESLKDALWSGWPGLGKGKVRSINLSLHFLGNAGDAGGRVVVIVVLVLFVSYPFVYGVVLAVMERLLEVEHPFGLAGVDAVVVEHTINGYVLPRSRHHFLRDVAHRCTHREKESWYGFMFFKTVCRNHQLSQAYLLIFIKKGCTSFLFRFGFFCNKGQSVWNWLSARAWVSDTPSDTLCVFNCSASKK